MTTPTKQRPLSPLDLEILAAMAQPGTVLRWHANKYPNPGLAGRGLILGPGSELRGHWYHGVPLSSYTVRRLIEGRHITPIDAANARPFSAGDPLFRDFTPRK